MQDGAGFRRGEIDMVRWLLWVLAVAMPLLVMLYLWLLHRRKKNSVRFASVALVKQAMGKGLGWRRHVPPILLGLAIATLLFAVSRPLAVIKLPSAQETIILAMDVSGSMRATDIKPSRIVAAQDAAKGFVNELPHSVRVGVVSFAGTAAVVQAPTLSREDVVAAIDRFQLQRATAIGSGIVLSLATLFPDAGYDLSQITGAKPMPPGFGDKKQDKPEFKPVEPGSYASAAIILLSDEEDCSANDGAALRPGCQCACCSTARFQTYRACAQCSSICSACAGVGYIRTRLMVP